MRGVMVTCSRNQEARCTSEISQLLDKALDERSIQAPVDTDAKGGATTSFADEIAKEIAELKNSSTRPYQAVGMGELSCIIFVKFSSQVGNPVELIDTLFKNNESGSGNAAR